VIECVGGNDGQGSPDPLSVVQSKDTGLDTLENRTNVQS